MADENDPEVRPLEPAPTPQQVEMPESHPAPLAETFTAKTEPAPQENSVPQQSTRERQIQQRLDELRTGREGILSESHRATMQEIQRRQEASQAREPLYQAVGQEASQPTPQMPAQTPLPQAPTEPIIDPEQFKSFFGPALIFSMLIGRVAKADMVDGLNMLSNSITGYTMGAKEKSAHDFEVFRAKFEAARQHEIDKIARYRTIVESQKYNLQQKMQLLEIESHREEDLRLQFALRQKDYEQALKVYGEEEKMVGQLSGQYDKLVASLEAGVTRVEVANIQAQSREKAAGTRAQIQREVQQLRQGNDANKAIQWYEQRVQAIEKEFEQTVKSAALKAGSNAELVETITQMAAETAAETMASLNTGVKELTYGGGKMTLNEGATLYEDPNWWQAKAKGFAAISKFIPPVTMSGAAQPPSQPQNKPAPGAPAPQPSNVMRFDENGNPVQ